MVKEAHDFSTPPKNTLTHLYATVEQQYLHPVYSNAEMPTRRPGTAATVVGTVGFESPAKPGMRGLCSFSRMVTKTGALNGWFLVGEGLGSLWKL